jgi:hypothetical protein
VEKGGYFAPRANRLPRRARTVFLATREPSSLATPKPSHLENPSKPEGPPSVVPNPIHRLRRRSAFLVVIPEGDLLLFFLLHLFLFFLLHLFFCPGTHPLHDEIH